MCIYMPMPFLFHIFLTRWRSKTEQKKNKKISYHNCGSNRQAAGGMNLVNGRNKQFK